MAKDKVPVTILTGFLGSGKTTLLNHILTAQHGKKIAVIENEFGEVGIDDALIKPKLKTDTEEDVIEMMNGCICCTVRQDLVEVLKKLAKRSEKGLKLDAIVIETTGLADPAPVAQTFFVDDDVKEFCTLDGIITLVDAKHVVQHLDDEKPEGAENEAVEQVAFADRLILNKCDLVPEESELKKVEDRLRAINKFAPIVRSTQAKVSADQVLNIKAFDLEKTLEMDPEFLNTDGEHEHDTTVSSVSITQDGEIDLALIEDWIGVLLRKQGADLYRMKGVLHIAHATKKFVYHAVHMIFNGDFEDWDEGEPKSNKLVFIGKNLDAAALRAAFAECLATPENLEKKLQALRFKVGDRVECHMGGGDYRAGAVTRLMWRDPEMEQGQVCPYGVLLDSGSTTWAPADVDEVIRAEGPKGQKRPLDPSA